MHLLLSQKQKQKEALALGILDILKDNHKLSIIY